ncbi:MAG: DUF1887 family CARF protein [Lachnospiraceae bacterium]|nr:DUF1887 family CARF protein [Lachnospiraceae bacterium]
MFRNAASASVIRPGRILWLLYLDEKTDEKSPIYMARRTIQFLNKKGVRCEKNFFIVESPSVDDSRKDSWRSFFHSLKEEQLIADFQIHYNKSADEAIGLYAEYLTKESPDLFDGTSALFSSSLSNADFAHSMRQRFPYFEFDCRTRKFSSNETCKYVSYINDHTYLGIEEMFSLAKAEDMEYNYPSLGRYYKELWNIYIGKNRELRARPFAVSNWNEFCNICEEYERNRKKGLAWEPISLETLRNYHEKYYDKYFRKPGMGADKVQSTKDSYWRNLFALISELCGEIGGTAFLIPEKKNGQITSFRYRDQDVKELLTKAGTILEICVYFEVCESGWFDDAACGYRFKWESDTVSNELDLVLTKGFQSIIVECKATKRLEEGFYFKLSGLCDLFGINTRKVLLTTSDMETADRANITQQERGELMDVTTVYGTDLKELVDRLKKLVANG